MKINLKVIQLRKWYLGFSAFMIIASIFFFLFSPLNLSVDFKGGELLQLQFKESLNREKLNQTFDSLEGEIPQLNSKRLQYSEDNTIVLRTEQLTDVQRETLLKNLTEKTGSYEIVKNDKVGPTIGKELTANALKALLIGSILIIIYMTFRFEFVYAIAGLAALLHDIIISVGLIALFRFEIDTPFIAAILTILGYSINDTIVVFDRIRENEHNEGRTKDFGQIVEESVNQVFVRSSYTAITTTFSVLMLLLFGGDSLRTFSMTLLLGMIFGTYSSVFMASPLVYLMRKYRKPKDKSKNKTKKNEKPKIQRNVNGYDEKEKVLV